MNPTYPAIPKSGGLGFFPTGISCWRQKLLILPTFLVCCAHPARAELIQHLDATITSSVTEDGNGIVTQWSDLSGAGNHATPSVGTVSYPSTSLSGTGKPGLKFGPTRSSLELFSGAESDSWLNQSANPNGFCVLVAFKCDGFVNNWNDFIGNSSGVESGFGIRYSEAGNFAAYMMGTIGAGGTVAVNDTVVVGLNYNAISGSYTYWNSDNGFANVGNKVAGDFSNGNAVTLGSTTSSGRHINGVLYEVKVYDSALTSLEFETQRNSLVEKWIQAPTGEPPVPPGPGVPNVLQTANALLSDVGPAPGQFPRTVGLDFVNGYLILDSRGVAVGNSNTAMQVWDISNPSIPFEVPNTRVSIKNPMHTYTMFLPHHRTSSDGVSEFINHVRDPLNITKGAPAGYTPMNNGSRGVTLFPYQYSGQSSFRITDARSAQVLSQVAPGFDGATTVIGNLLIYAGIRGMGSGLATYDISDPSTPVLLDLIGSSDPIWNHPEPAYEYFIWKHYLVMPNSFGRKNECAFVDFSDPSNLRYMFRTQGDNLYGKGLAGRTRYAQFQDHKMFLGAGIYDMRPLENNLVPPLLAVHPHAGEYMLPLGNLYVSAANQEQGKITEFPECPEEGFAMRIFAHEAAPDSVGPTVAYHNPVSGAVNQHAKSRIGVVIHETLDYASMNSSAIRVFPVTGGADVAGTLNWHDKDILTFTPNADLAPGTTYRVQVVQGGIKDVSGNGITGYSFDFTTANPASGPPITVTDFSYAPYPAPINGTANLSVTASGGSGTLEYSWSFGDDTPQTEFSAANASITHTYTQAGHYTAVVRVRDGGTSPQMVTRSITVTVASVPAGPVASKGSQMAVDAANRRIWTVNPDNDTVTSIHADTLAKVSEFAVGKDPRSIALDVNGNLWITCLDDDRLEVRSTTGALVGSFNFRHGARPHDVVFNAAKTKAFVSLMGSGMIARFDPAVTPLAVEAELSAGATSAAIAVNNATDKLLVNRFISPDTQGEVRLFDHAGGNLSLAQTIALPVDTDVVEEGRSARGLPNYLADVAIDPLNQFAYVTAQKANILRGTFRDGKPLTHETTVRTMVSKIDLSTNTEANRIDIDDSSQPTAMVFSPLGDYLFIAMQGNNQVKVMDAFTGQVLASLSTGLAPQGLAFDTVGNRLFVNSLTERKVTVFDLSEALSKGSFPSTAAATISTVANETFPSDVLRGKQVFYNASESRMSLDGYLSCASCHQDGDHDGRVWDFTNRGEGLRNTTNLRGRAGMAHGNVHWSGNFDEIQDFDLDMKNHFGGTGFIAGGAHPSMGAPNAGRNTDLDALAAYLTSLGKETIEKSPHRQANGRLTAEAMTGKRYFAGTRTPGGGNTLKCFTCHGPNERLTDSAIGTALPPTAPPNLMHNIATILPSSGLRLGTPLAGIDTPTLLGLHASAPYLHDGRAADVAAVFDYFDPAASLTEPGSAHDLSSTGYNLNSADKGRLIAYLNQIDGRGDDDFVAPPVPSGLTATAGSGSITVDWQDSTAADILEYNISRRVLNTTAITTVATGVPTSIYVDNTAVSGTTYQYRLTAVDVNDNESAFSGWVTGTPISAIEIWRQTHFGSPANSGDSADLYDFDKDGLVNLLEFAFGLDPKLASSAQIPGAQINGDNCVISFSEPVGMMGITYGAEWSETLLTEGWTPIPDTGIGGLHTFSVPIENKTKVFIRLKVTLQ